MYRVIRSLLLLVVATLAVTGVSSAAHAASVGTAAYPSSKSISIAADMQDNGYFCGPASVRNALSGRGISSVQSKLAGEMGTDSGGTDSVANVTPVLNKHTGTGWYESKYISGNTATTAQVALLKKDILLDINKKYVIVANIVGTAKDTAGHNHTYSTGHYIDVVGYSSSGSTAKIYDPANDTFYSMTTSRLATWIATRGYSA